MSARRRVQGWVAAVTLCGVLLVLSGCLPVPLGDPAKSTADSQLFGVWEWRDAHLNRAVVRPWDERTYVVDVLGGEAAGARGDATAPKSRSVFKAWLTEVKGQRFMTLQAIDTIGVVNGDTRPPTYLVMRLTIEGTRLTAAAINPQFKAVSEAKTAGELERAIAAHLDDPKLFGSPVTMARWTSEQMKGLDALQETFRDWKQPQ
jgi:hypothetical protein